MSGWEWGEEDDKALREWEGVLLPPGGPPHGSMTWTAHKLRAALAELARRDAMPLREAFVHAVRFGLEAGSRNAYMHGRRYQRRAQRADDDWLYGKLSELLEKYRDPQEILRDATPPTPAPAEAKWAKWQLEQAALCRNVFAPAAPAPDHECPPARHGCPECEKKTAPAPATAAAERCTCAGKPTYCDWCLAQGKRRWLPDPTPAAGPTDGPIKLPVSVREAGQSKRGMLADLVDSEGVVWLNARDGEVVHQLAAALNAQAKR